MLDKEQYYKKYYSDNKEKIKQRRKQWRLDNKDKDNKYCNDYYHKIKNDPERIISYLLMAAKIRAKKKSLEFSLVKDDIILPIYCPILGVKLSRENKRYTYSLDRINPKEGYTKENTWVISLLANSMKWDSTPEERLAFANWIISNEKEKLYV